MPSPVTSRTMEERPIHGEERDGHNPEEEEDDTPTLSSHALAALQEFLREQEEKRQPEVEPGDDDVALVSEDWRLSQFWYDRDTAETVAGEVLSIISGFPESRVACIACPTLFAYLKVSLLSFASLSFEVWGALH